MLPTAALAESVDYSPIEGIAFELPATVGGALAVVLGLMFLNSLLAATIARRERRFSWSTFPEFPTTDVLWIAILLGVLAAMAWFIGQWFLTFYFAKCGILALVLINKIKLRFKALIESVYQEE